MKFVLFTDSLINRVVPAVGKHPEQDAMQGRSGTVCAPHWSLWYEFLARSKIKFFGLSKWYLPFGAEHLSRKHKYTDGETSRIF